VIELRIEQLLEERGKTFYWLAKETGIGHISIWRLRHGEAKTISLDYLERICRALECEPGELFALVDDRRASKRGRKAR
jgi:putative transcriptional regulator